MSLDKNEVATGQRFEFGANWARFLRVLNDERIRVAEDSLKRMLGVESLEGKSFVDVGSGSGLFSLVARRLGARVHSFDYDPKSVACTAELKRRYFADDPEWVVEEGSVLDGEYLGRLGQFDVVYSWGVLHHTGAMWQALENVVSLVAQNGRLFIAIYNDQGGWSKRWRVVKRTYNALPKALRLPYGAVVMGARELKFLAFSAVKGKPTKYFENAVSYHRHSLRGMSYWHDLIDWVGGYPFEVGKPEEIFSYYRERGFVMDRLVTCGSSIGCNEFVFTRTDISETVA